MPETVLVNGNAYSLLKLLGKGKGGYSYLAQMADGARVRGLPVHITHGALDWMFDVSLAREAAEAMRAAGAQVVYREVDDLSHVYAAELNPEILAWLAATSSAA